MALTASCPSCGAPVVFQSAGSVFAVCGYCQSTLFRHDDALEDLGKMAPLAEDRSPLQLGSEGKYKGVHFALIGRLQLRYSQGLWNEWHLLFDDMRTGWLSEAGGEYVLTFAQPVQEPLPAFADLTIGQRLTLAGESWTVSNLEEAICVAGEGELPFRVGAGYPVPAADLRNPAHFATLDYSETPPLLFSGEAILLGELALANLRDGTSVTGEEIAARVFHCPGCGAPLQARSLDILAVGCNVCGTVTNTADDKYRVLSKALEATRAVTPPRIPLGSKGTLDEQPVEVIGFLIRQCKIDGITYAWREYLLAGNSPRNRGTYRWLTESDGHWNVADVLSRPPVTSGIIEVDDLRYDNQVFRHFSTTPTAEVTQATGEFTWRVRRGETCRVIDYVAPPRMLSRESNANDLNWSLARYVPPETIAQAFRLPQPLPGPTGVYANQPNPWEESHRTVCQRFWKLALLAVALQIIALLVFPGRELLRQPFQFAPPAAQEQQSRTFLINHAVRRLAVHHQTSLNNNWMAVDLLLVNQATGQARRTSREISFYHGYDDGHWSEGSQDDEVVFRDIPPGTYYLVLDPEFPPETRTPVSVTLSVTAGGIGWANLVLLMLFLAAFPIFSRFRLAAFEARRWAESDHPPASSSEDD